MTPKESFIIRSVQEKEIPETVTVLLETLADMRKRFGVANPPEDHAYWQNGYKHVLRTGIFEVAEVDGRIAAICCGIVRGDRWFLTAFWTLPQYQGKQIGSALVKSVWERATKSGAKVFFTWSTVDPRAMNIYLKLGMMPGYQILTFGGEISNVGDSAVKYKTESMKSSEVAVSLDHQHGVVDKKVDHDFFLLQKGYEAKAVYIDNLPIGYFYAHDGFIGPACWISDDYAAAVLEAAFNESLAQNSESTVRLCIPGINHKAIRFAQQSGLQLAKFAHFLTSAEFGALDKYLPSGPLLF